MMANESSLSEQTAYCDSCSMSAGRAFRKLVAKTWKGVGYRRAPVQILGAVNPYCALLAEKQGARALYLSGSGVATASHGLPDLGITNLDDVLVDVRRITAVTELPLLVDIDTGFGSAFGIQRTVREMERAGVACVHMEDQAAAKRCGHRPGKQIVSVSEMVDRISAAVEARQNGMQIMARSDALASEGLDATLRRLEAYVKAGADMIFPEAFSKLDEYHTLAQAGLTRDGGAVPFLANITEFGKTPLFLPDQLGEAGVAMVLHPLSAHRAMARAAERVYAAILQEGSVRSVLDDMQTREELYTALDYHTYEQTIDRLFGSEDQEKTS